ncbi:MAG TPA: hypothetical protein VFI31_21010 [Pirellulales bacterium]|nr:hypothetical protein [Pirellulales bacterium]
MTTSTALSSLPAVSSAVTVVPQACGLPVCVTGVHPAAALFPLMHGSELELLVEDIVKNGLREPIVLYQGLILDGRNRLHACELAQVEPRFIGWDGEGSPLAFVLSRNLHRRHLDESQRAVIAARAKVMFKKEATDRDRANRLSSRAKSSANEPDDEQNSRVPANGANLHRWQRVNAKAGVVLNVSARLVATATRVLAAGDEELIAAVETGLVSVSDAAAILELPKDKQRQAVAAVHSGNARTLRQAVELSLTGGPPAGGEPAAPQVSPDAEPPKVSVRQLRRACQRFTAGHAKLCRDIDRAAQACGGANDHTRRAFEALSVALRAMQTCLQEFAPRVRPK